ncbi:F-box/LRR-repeat protein At3g58900-like [Coffea eugenioides]|uniref:F-box/LRR-repeat protein At3g58900-like n=1 Tax=Coffea eugenioides TaxID=49369 RepID=UPI000F60FE28|nr:F-box/LRR-repeat protein At3g58900-like [Coffea eugenioides]
MAHTRRLRHDDGSFELPEPIRHHILSFLKPKESAKLSLLSKGWLTTWRTRPNLHFEYDEDESGSDDRQALERRRDSFINCINTTLMRYRENKYGIDSLKLMVYNEDFPSLKPDHVKTWLGIAAENGVKGLEISLKCDSYHPKLARTIFEATSLVELYLSEKIYMKHKMIKIIRCHDLRKLCLNKVGLDEVMLQRIMSSCPSIEFLEIIQCLGIENIEVTKLQKLKQCSIVLWKIGNVEVEAPNLEDFSYGTCVPAMPASYLLSEEEEQPLPCLQVSRCKNLRKLSLDNIGITDEFFSGIAEDFQHLEELKIRYCYGLQTVRISSQSIKLINLEFRKEGGLKEAQIDVPSIVRFEYRGNFIPLLSFAPPSGPWVSYIELSWQNRNILETSCFSELKELLMKLNLSEISLRIIFPKNVEGFVEDQIRNKAIYPLPQVQTLSISFDKANCLDVAYSVLDGIFWTCRPKTIVQHSCQDLDSHKDASDLLNVFFQMLMLRRNHLYGNFQQTKFWQEDLKDVKLGMFKEGQRVQLPRLSDWEAFSKVITAEGRSLYVVFELEWEYFMIR